MNTEKFFQKRLLSFFVLCLAVSASQADTEVKIDSVSQTVGVMGKNMEVTLTGSEYSVSRFNRNRYVCAILY